MNIKFLNKKILSISLALLIAVNLISWFYPLLVIIQLLVNSSTLTYLATVVNVPMQKKNDEIKKSSLQEAEPAMTMRDAMMFPVVASVMLFSLKLCYQYLPDLFPLIVRYLFMVMAFFLFNKLLATFLPVLLNLNPSLSEVIFNQHVGKIGQIFINSQTLVITKIYLLCLPISALTIASQIYFGSYLANNLIGAALVVQSIGSINVGRTQVALLVLWGLFIYDVFWVFGTDVMVTVAKSMKIPALLKFPLPNPTEDKKFSMLGLGDIIVPSLYLVLCLKFDIDRAILQKPKSLLSIKMPTFNGAFVGYVVGILLTGFVMLYFSMAQPALLYLVPCICIGSFLNSPDRLALFNYKEADPTEEQCEQTEASRSRQNNSNESS